MKNRFVLLMLAGLTLPSPAWAGPQGGGDEDSLHPGAIELGFMAGKSLGNVGGASVNFPNVISYRISGNGTVAGTMYVGAAVTERFLAVAEASFLNGSHSVHDLGGGTTVQTYTRALYFDAAMEWRLRRPGRLFVPYVGLGVGTTQSRADALVIFSASPPPVGSAGVVQAATQVRFREPAFAPMLLSGADFFLGHHIGFRLEGRGMLPTGSSHDPIGEVAAGIFFYFH
jgi:hypothetical protein